jgi:hypothetical protein
LRPSLGRDSVAEVILGGNGFMMGRRGAGQGQFFYSFDLDKVVPPDHLVRQIDNVLDLSWVHKELAPYYSHTGRPSIDGPALSQSRPGASQACRCIQQATEAVAENLGQAEISGGALSWDVGRRS